LKACGLFTAAVKKRNRILRSGETASPDAGFAAHFRLVRHPAAATFVTPAQFVHQVLQMGRQVRGLRSEALLQPFAHSVADRSASLAIDRFNVVGETAVHDEFRFLLFIPKTKSLRVDWFPFLDRLRVFLVKFE
jgi:hypothetical protein